jgi:uncharacterized membrane protein
MVAPEICTLIVEELDDGSYTVLVPSVPTPMAGAIYILPTERVHPFDVPFTKAISVFSKWGAERRLCSSDALRGRAAGNS